MTSMRRKDLLTTSCGGTVKSSRLKHASVIIPARDEANPIGSPIPKIEEGLSGHPFKRELLSPIKRLPESGLGMSGIRQLSCEK